MKISLTEKFLWDMYFNVFERAGDIAYMFSDPYRQHLIAPDNPVWGRYRRKIQAAKFSQLIYYLKKKNYIASVESDGKSTIVLTHKGASIVLKASFRTKDKALIKRKDARWSLIMFDVPEKSRGARGLLRSILRNLGYTLLQQSVWVSPYDVAKKTEQFLQFYRLEKYVKVFLVEEV